MIPDTPWARDAKCRDHPDPDLWFPTRDDGGAGAVDSRPAKAICRSCPVKRDCLDYALTAGEKWGVWGGTTEKERRRIARERGRELMAGRAA